MLWINGKMTDLTKKDAIHKLVDAKCFLERYSNPHDKWTEAINIGIEAIEIVMDQEEQEPTIKSDLGVEEINIIDKSNFSQEQYKADLQSAYDCGYNQACKDKITMPYATPDNCGNYIEQTTKNNLEVDCIDRNSIKYYPGTGGYMYASKGEIDKLPSVTPQPRKGHWIHRNAFLVPWKCSECNYKSESYDNFCPNCGADMREVEV